MDSVSTLGVLLPQFQTPYPSVKWAVEIMKIIMKGKELSDTKVTIFLIKTLSRQEKKL